MYSVVSLFACVTLRGRRWQKTMITKVVNVTLDARHLPCLQAINICHFGRSESITSPVIW